MKYIFNRKQGKRLAVLSLVVVIVFAGTFLFSLLKERGQAEVDCFDELSRSAAHLSHDMTTISALDKALLSALADRLAAQETLTHESIATVLNSFNSPSSRIAYLEYLESGNLIVHKDGTISDVTDRLDFEEEIRKGFYISGEVPNLFNSSEMIFRHAVPVIRNGIPIGMLYGIIPAEKFCKTYTAPIYKGKVNLTMIDGDTGRVLLDTGSYSATRLSEMTDLQPLKGYNFADTEADMKEGNSGTLAFRSKLDRSVQYAYYTPCGINNWSILLTVPQQDALRQMYIFNGRKNLTLIIGMGIFLLYAAYMAASLIHSNKLAHQFGMEDQTTQLQNRNAYDKFMQDYHATLFNSVGCIFLDANGLHEINNKNGHAAGDCLLKTVGKVLRDEFGYRHVYRIGGDEFVVFRENIDLNSLTDRMLRINQKLEQEHYSVSYGIAFRKNECGLDRLVREADDDMLAMKKNYYQKHNRRKYR